ncbi:AI-2E family transporter [Cupriavidus sp. AU9028]|uniref:AI-2E family transporter n=1 Tax=Cupriavidus sp. AU9028 TaxID=2871157 RepID=UPI001C951C56|nr:AI-2E family transporter [Cupriavidus sp. AU9028]MBY4898178.1 AI-2E family transporter [Cupriavidus sp. AU9028]
MQQKAFYILLAIVTVAFFWVLLPFFSAVFWGVILAIIFTPVNNWMTRRMNGRANTASLVTLLLCLVVVVVPMFLVGASLISEGTYVVQQIRSGQINFGAYFEQAMRALPAPISAQLTRLELTDFASVQEKLANAAGQASQYIATQALSIGQNTAQFVISFGIMLYLLFFLLRDGARISRRIRMALPLDDQHKLLLLQKFTGVIRATIKGNIAVALLQGLLGGLLFWGLGIQGPILWGVVMAALSLLPAIGAGLIWAPVAIYFLLTGAIVKGVIVIAFGAVVIGSVDNVLRPILVGKDTKMPDWVILISTLGGLSLFGINGFVIGPLIAALFIASWDLFASMRDHDKGL